MDRVAVLPQVHQWVHVVNTLTREVSARIRCPGDAFFETSTGRDNCPKVVDAPLGRATQVHYTNAVLWKSRSAMSRAEYLEAVHPQRAVVYWAALSHCGLRKGNPDVDAPELMDAKHAQVLAIGHCSVTSNRDGADDTGRGFNNLMNLSYNPAARTYDKTRLRAFPSQCARLGSPHLTRM
jgi:hypothetical protein